MPEFHNTPHAFDLDDPIAAIANAARGAASNQRTEDRASLTLKDHLAHSNEQLLTIEKIVCEALDNLIKQAIATKEELVVALGHNRMVNKAAMNAVEQAQRIAADLDKQHKKLRSDFIDVLKTRPEPGTQTGAGVMEPDGPLPTDGIAKAHS